MNNIEKEQYLKHLESEKLSDLEEIKSYRNQIISSIKKVNKSDIVNVVNNEEKKLTLWQRILKVIQI